MAFRQLVEINARQQRGKELKIDYLRIVTGVGKTTAAQQLKKIESLPFDQRNHRELGLDAAIFNNMHLLIGMLQTLISICVQTYVLTCHDTRKTS